ncbi:hypothetical protein AJ80_10008 [Polytolypa hystricis UAMH7299]|uniref:Mur ligase central domain-containing protein n=1 Tax=Polytolypa hystricis (strain UAMH7299) TaxID=1447883 RepID=A0A2B7WER5_POLH7|nr:hypothetical protein AJ80_10008 [Polytolypa hystricis UAMH7299]
MRRIKFLSHPLPTNDNTSFTSPLLFLLYALGCSQIRHDILFRGLRVQKRWNVDGNVHEVPLQDFGLNLQIARLLSDQSIIQDAINFCVQQGNITVNGLSDDSLAYSISDRSRHEIFQSLDNEEADLLGLMFIAYIYPRDEILEPSFHRIRKLLSPYMERTWQYVEDTCPSLPEPVRDTFVEATLAACRLLPPSRAHSLILALKSIKDPHLPDHLRMAVAFQESVSLRFKGDHNQSDVVIRDILAEVSVGSTDIRVHCGYGRLQLSRAENAILREEFNKAMGYLASWETKFPLPSGLELKVVRLKSTVLGRLSRYEGNFDYARLCLEQCLGMTQRDTSRYHIMHHLADVYCELEIPRLAEELVRAEIQQLSTDGEQHSRAFRRLSLPLAEAYTMQSRGDEARPLLCTLIRHYEQMDSLDVSNQVGHVRSVIGLARLHESEGRWMEAGQTLETARSLTEKYNTFLKGGFYTGVIYLFFSKIKFALGDKLEAWKFLESAREIRSVQKEQHFIPGLGTYFLGYLDDWAKAVYGSASSVATPARYREAIRCINSRRSRAKPNLSEMRGSDDMVRWLELLGHSVEDLNRLNVIHVAGTKGKGSTCAFVASILIAHGNKSGYPQKVGLYTSPHMSNIRERIRINGEPISQDLFTIRFFEIWEKLPVRATPSLDVPRYLQLLALLSFHVFIQDRVDVAIFETHLGGEFDATNIISAPIVTAITSISMDHRKLLGPTIEHIAWHKAGIFKPGSLAFSSLQEQAVATVLRQRATEKGVVVKFVGLDSALPTNAVAIKPKAQKLNCSLALAVVWAWLSAKLPIGAMCVLRILQGAE